MTAIKYLTLESIRLKPSGEWAPGGVGLGFVILRQGDGVLGRGEARESVRAGDVLVMHSESTARLRGRDGAELALQCFSAAFEHLIPLLGPKELTLLQNVIDGFKQPRVYPAASPVAQECHRLLTHLPPLTTPSHRSGLLNVAACVLADEFSRANAHCVGFVRSDEHMAEVFERLSAAEIMDLSVPDLAKKFSCSRRHLNRLFHQHFGISVSALKMEMRLLKAVALLQDPSAKILKVAEDCGFNHLGLFNTCFKRRFGTSPTAYRRNGGRGEPASQLAGHDDGTCSMRHVGLCPWQSGSPPRPGKVPLASTLAREVEAARKPAAQIPPRNGGESAPAEPVRDQSLPASAATVKRQGLARSADTFSHEVDGGMKPDQSLLSSAAMTSQEVPAPAAGSPVGSAAVSGATPAAGRKRLPDASFQKGTHAQVESPPV